MRQMKSRDIVGRKIVRVIQRRCQDNCGDQVYDVHGFVLDNGAVVTFSVVELGYDYAVEAKVRKRIKEG